MNQLRNTPMLQTNPVPAAPPSLAAEIFALMDALIARLGLVEYCKWLAAATPAAWCADAPYAEVRDGLRAKVEEMRL